MLLVDCSAALLDEVGNMSVFIVTPRLLFIWLSDCDVDDTGVEDKNVVGEFSI